MLLFEVLCKLIERMKIYCYFLDHEKGKFKIKKNYNPWLWRMPTIYHLTKRIECRLFKSSAAIQAIL